MFYSSVRKLKTQQKKPSTVPNKNDIEKATGNCQKCSAVQKVPNKFSYFQLFRYSTSREKSLVFVGVLLATLASIGVPFSIVLYGEFASLLIDRVEGEGTPRTPTFIIHLFGGGVKLRTNSTKVENFQAITNDAFAYLVGILVGMTILLTLLALAIYILNLVASSQITKIRKHFLESTLRQDMTWYEITSGNNFTSKLTGDIEKIKDGIGEKLGIFAFLIGTFVFGILTSFCFGWELTLVVLICCPFLIMASAIVAILQSSFAAEESLAYSYAGTQAEEVFSSIHTVVAFSGECKEMKRFAQLLVPAETIGLKKGLYSGISAGLMWFIIYACYALVLWYGVKLLLADRNSIVPDYSPAVLVIVQFGIVMGTINVGLSLPHLEAFSVAKGAAQKVFSVIDRKSEIDPMSTWGLKPANVIGNIEFEDIHFKYPARCDVEVLHGLKLSAKAGQTVALVGPSGCGKSTLLQLMQRFYDPPIGAVKLDGIHLDKLNVGWLRAQIGVVGQEPVLFATTIGENIRYGNPKVTQKEIEDAARMANCHDFIKQLPKGYDTTVGERGAQMSGGQKQRIAIARALVRNPKILLLDEPTSALDPTSERYVQDALEVARKGRTTLVVSHRLSTVTNCDKIVFVKDGVVAEEGTHEELLAKGGLYYQLVNITQRKQKSGLESPRASPPQLNIRQKIPAFKDGQSLELVATKSIEAKSKGGNEEKYSISFRQLWQLSAPEWKYILCGCIAATLHGATYPLWAVSYGDFFGVMSNDDANYVEDQTDFIGQMFLLIGFIAGVGTLFQTYMFNTAGVKMTSRLRKQAFNTIIHQEMAYFDDERNSVGALCARLSGDCAGVQGATGARIGVIVQALATLVTGIVISLMYSWNLTLVTLAVLPLVFFATFFESRVMASSAYAEKLAMESASQVAVEAIANIRTVVGLGHEPKVLERYNLRVDSAGRACQKKSRYRGVVYGLGQAVPYIGYGISLYYGSHLVASFELPYQDIIKISEALIFGAWMLGQAFAYAPDVSGAILSAGRLLNLFQTKPDQSCTQDGLCNSFKRPEYEVTYNDVDFHYPNRKSASVLANLNLTIKSGTTVALVGPSGSGKSTCVQLLLRYYDPVKGQVKLCGVPTTEFSFGTLRSVMGLVSQEPVLFDRTIAENIAYGNNFHEDISMAEIEKAAKISNIHNFIISLPLGYNTSLGSRGAQLSGGQKQRIAIARAMIRKPDILILDEATSALDMESEQVVKEALDAARSGRTCLMIAHRLATVRDADLICVMRNGVIVEQGNHEELMALNGTYAELYWMQQVS